AWPRTAMINRRLLPDAADWPRTLEELADPRFRGKVSMATTNEETTVSQWSSIRAARGDVYAWALADRLIANGLRTYESNKATRGDRNGAAAVRRPPHPRSAGEDHRAPRHDARAPGQEGLRSARSRLGGSVLDWLSVDGKKLLVTRILRTFAYGYLAVVLGLYLDKLGMGPVEVGLVFTAAIAGSAVMTIFWSIVADRYGRRRTVATMAILMFVGGLVFALTNDFWMLLLGAFTGTISATSS